MNFGQNERYTIVAGQAISQFRGVTAAGSYATSGITFYGVNDQKPSTGDHIGVITMGEAKLQVSSGGIAKDDLVSITTSGYGTKVLSGFHAIGRCVYAATSGGIANVFIFGGPAYVNA